MDIDQRNEDSDRKLVAFQMMKDFMDQYKERGFNEAISLGDIQKYKNEIDSVRITIDKKQDSQAKYIPRTIFNLWPTISLNTDPLAITPAMSDYHVLGDDLWHEVTHRLEDVQGDFKWFETDELRAERNIAYMDMVANTALNILDGLERYVRSNPDASLIDLKARWDNFVEAMHAAIITSPEVKKYPPNLDLMKEWFGFDVDVEKIRQFYASGKMGVNFKKMAEQVLQYDWTGAWNTTYGEVIFEQNGMYVTGKYTYDGGKIEGYANGNKLLGRWSVAPSFSGDWNAGPLEFTISEDGKRFDGVWRFNNEKVYLNEWDGVKIEPEEEEEKEKPKIPESVPIEPETPEYPLKIIGSTTVTGNYPSESGFFAYFSFTVDLDLYSNGIIQDNLRVHFFNESMWKQITIIIKFGTLERKESDPGYSRVYIPSNFTWDGINIYDRHDSGEAKNLTRSIKFLNSDLNDDTEISMVHETLEYKHP